jgi:hypothetical protein
MGGQHYKEFQGDRLWTWEVEEHVSRSSTVLGFGISSVELTDTITSDLDDSCFS